MAYDPTADRDVRRGRHRARHADAAPDAYDDARDEDSYGFSYGDGVSAQPMYGPAPNGQPRRPSRGDGGPPTGEMPRAGRPPAGATGPVPVDPSWRLAPPPGAPPPPGASPPPAGPPRAAPQPVASPPVNRAAMRALDGPTRPVPQLEGPRPGQRTSGRPAAGQSPTGQSMAGPFATTRRPTPMARDPMARDREPHRTARGAPTPPTSHRSTWAWTVPVPPDRTLLGDRPTQRDRPRKPCRTPGLAPTLPRSAAPAGICQRRSASACCWPGSSSARCSYGARRSSPCWRSGRASESGRWCTRSRFRADGQPLRRHQPPRRYRPGRQDQLGRRNQPGHRNQPGRSTQCPRPAPNRRSCR